MQKIEVKVFREGKLFAHYFQKGSFDLLVEELQETAHAYGPITKKNGVLSFSCLSDDGFIFVQC